MVKNDRKNINNYYVLAFSSMMLPLFDLHHSIVAYVVLIINLLSIYDFKYRINMKYIYFVCSFFIGLIMFKTYNYGFKIIYPNNVNHFEYRFIRYDSLEFTNDVIDYMKKNDDKDYVFVVSGAYYYRLITDSKITYLDLINYGNFGYKGTEKIIKMIKKNKNSNTVFVISEADLSDECQVDKKAVKYIIDHGKKIANVKIYDFYILE